MADWAAVADHVEGFLADYLVEADAEGYVVGVSGGLDSSVALELAVAAVGADRVTGLVLPAGPSEPENMADARDLCESLAVDYEQRSIEELVEAVAETVPDELDTVSRGNVQARARMTVLFAVANERDLLVVGPNNRSELLLGYFTKYGDGAADVAPLADYYKTEVADLASAVGVPDHIVEKTPTAELWEGQTDEGELGASYEIIDAILRAAVDDGLSVAATAVATGEDRQTVRRFLEMYEHSAHKRRRPPSPGRLE